MGGIGGGIRESRTRPRPRPRWIPPATYLKGQIRADCARCWRTRDHGLDSNPTMRQVTLAADPSPGRGGRCGSKCGARSGNVMVTCRELGPPWSVCTRHPGSAGCVQASSENQRCIRASAVGKEGSARAARSGMAERDHGGREAPMSRRASCSNCRERIA
ncbi:hypothetical protein OBBRIDRAFT_379245 [Obba rivulosa]|uniref:Uncharacterized protein n=1 Tax=Obba rivulosa TaxID=1052685 RepID=A0A8E2B5G1_9APHY|nr:hypothetical protein OBBRIDRAFT_379245 [Obba rivulosa]